MKRGERVPFLACIRPQVEYPKFEFGDFAETKSAKLEVVRKNNMKSLFL